MSFRSKFIGDKNFYRNLITLVIPLIVQQGITNFVSLLDNVMVGRLGTESMSGVAIVNQLIFVFNLAIFGGVSGASIFGAQFFGVGDHKGVRDILRFKLVFGVGATILAIAVFLLWGDPLISLFLSEGDSGGDLQMTLELAKNYMLVALIGLFPFMIVQCYSSSLRETGETVTPMIASTIAILVNLVFNYLLIFGTFGFPRLGVVGAAIATVLARFIECGYIVIATHHRQERFIFIRQIYRHFHISGDMAKKVSITAAPLLINEALWSVGMTIINQSYSTRGLTVVAATNINSTVWNLFSIIMMAMGNAVAILVGQQLGAGDMKKAKDTDNKLIFATVVLHLGIGALIILCAPFIPMIYNTEQAVKDLTTNLLFVAGLSLPISSFVHVTYFTMRSGGKTFITFLFDCVYTWIIPLPIAFFLCRYTAMPVIGIYACVQFSDIIKAIVGFLMLRSGIWMKNIIGETKETRTAVSSGD